VRQAPPPTMPQKPIPDPEDSNSLAIIDGALCRMNRKGRAVVRHAPIGTAVVQFLVVLFVYPETKGQTLEALQRRLVG